MKILLLIDANSLIHRAYHALPPLTTPDGEPIGAIYGLSSMLLKIIKEQKPDYVAAAFDRPEATFREGLFKDYKAHRPKIDEELINQLLKAHELFQKFNIPSFEKAGFEADDIIAFLVKKFKEEKGLKIVILTGDLDTLQIVSKNKVVVQTLKKGISETIIYNEAAVEKRYGLKPSELPDWKGLVGDPSDNIPGVAGIGPKTASKILKKYKTLENLYKELKPSDKLAKKLLDNKERALFFKKLATLNSEIPLEVNLENLIFNPRANGEIIKYFTELGFKSLIQRAFGVLSEKEVKTQKTAEITKAVKKEGVMVVTNPEEALKNKKALGSNKIKVAFDWKPILKELKRRKITLKPPLFDVKIAGWLLDPDQKDLSLRALGERFLLKTFEETKPQALTELYHFFSKKIKEYRLENVFEKIEMPLLRVLAAVEEWGIGVNKSLLKSLQENIEKELETLAKDIYKETGTVFNINSSRQVADVLFEKLGIKSLKKRKTMTGLRSTALGVLKDLKEEHPAVNLIIEYRESFKINSTFVKPLIEAVDENGRVHTTFLQTGTTTGRLASEKPNLQNLPQESKWSKDLRRAFETKRGSSFLAFDYSQLELRLLAHVSQDKKLNRAFWENIDIHKVTASRIFNVSLEKVTEAMRRVGKMLNFGVIYGMGPKSFSELSGVPLEKAEKFIEGYFQNFSGVKDWQDKVKAEVRTFGFVKNENGRRRWFLDIGPTHGTNRAYWAYRTDEIERAAINMPIQSLEADILKLAMIKSFEKLEEKNWLDSKAKLVLTIHDELLFEVNDDILKSVAQTIKSLMEEIYNLSVPLRVEVKTGKNLGELYVKEIASNL